MRGPCQGEVCVRGACSGIMTRDCRQVGEWESGERRKARPVPPSDSGRARLTSRSGLADLLAHLALSEPAVGELIEYARDDPLDCLDEDGRLLVGTGASSKLYTAADKYLARTLGASSSASTRRRPA